MEKGGGGYVEAPQARRRIGRPLRRAVRRHPQRAALREAQAVREVQRAGRHLHTGSQ